MTRFTACLVVGLLFLGACDNRFKATNRKKKKKNPSALVPGVQTPPPAAQPVPFEGRGFLTAGDLEAMGVPSDPRIPNPVAYDMYGAFHRYRCGAGELEVMILPMSDPAAAAQRANQEFTNENNQAKLGQKLGKVLEFSAAREAITGSNCWVTQTIRAEGMGLVKIGFSKGPFVVKVMWQEGAAGRSKLAEIKEKASRAARHIAGKLR